MAITSSGHENPTRFFGLAGDTKPTSAMVGATFYETDTPDLFVFDGASWVSFRLNIDIASSTVDLMLGTDFSAVFGTSDLTLSGQGDNLTNAVLVLKTASLLYGYDGTTWDRIRGDAADGLLVNLGSNNDVTPVPKTSGGLSIFKSIDLDESEEAVKTSAGQLFSGKVFNTTAAPLFLKLYDATVATVVVGTTVPDITIPIPANADSDVAGFVFSDEHGTPFATAITAACTTGVADNDNGAPGANACIVWLGYK